MIAYLEGRALSVSFDTVVVVVGGVGYAVKATPTTLSQVSTGGDCALHTSMIVREDSMTLFGFLATEERDLFEVLLGVSGIGPKVALSVLSVLRPDEFRRAIHAEDTTTITRVPGLAKRGAQRLILELKGKIADAAIVTDGNVAPVVVGAAADAVVEALVGLGWGEKPAREAVTAVMAQPEFASGADMSTLLRAALQHLGGRA